MLCFIKKFMNVNKDILFHTFIRKKYQVKNETISTSSHTRVFDKKSNGGNIYELII